MAWMKTQITQKSLSQEPRWNSSATTAQQFQDNTSTATSGLHCNLMLHLSSSHLSPFGSNKVTNSVKEVFVIPI
jgi:hypothetical protein